LFIYAQRILPENLEERDYLGVLGVDGRIMLFFI
jgi:hypothetical protein